MPQFFDRQSMDRIAHAVRAVERSNLSNTPRRFRRDVKFGPDVVRGAIADVDIEPRTAQDCTRALVNFTDAWEQQTDKVKIYNPSWKHVIWEGSEVLYEGFAGSTDNETLLVASWSSAATEVLAKTAEVVAATDTTFQVNMVVPLDGAFDVPSTVPSSLVVVNVFEWDIPEVGTMIHAKHSFNAFNLAVDWVAENTGCHVSGF